MHKEYESGGKVQYKIMEEKKWKSKACEWIGESAVLVASKERD